VHITGSANTSAGNRDKESNMKTARIAKILSAAALVSLGLMAGTSQADNWGFYANVNAPEFNRAGSYPGRGPDFYPPRVGSPAIDQRQQRQMERIYEGIRSGQLTQHEARELIQNQRQIDYLERQYLADGYLSRDEWLDMNRRLNWSSEKIFVEKHDYDQRGWR
jgi:hypothetical protein